MKRTTAIFSAVVMGILILILVVVRRGEKRPDNDPLQTPIDAHVQVSGVLTRTVEAAIRRGEAVRVARSPHIDTVPAYVFSAQMKDPTAAWTLGDVLFLSVHHFDPRTLVDLHWGAQWVGLLASSDGGKTWEKFFEIHDPVTEESNPADTVNVESIFVTHGSLFLDLTNRRGAGSGEGHLTRIESSDGGKTWERTACLYFMPEDYYAISADGTLDRSVTTPLHLKDEAACSYPSADDARASLPACTPTGEPLNLGDGLCCNDAVWFPTGDKGRGECREPIPGVTCVGRGEGTNPSIPPVTGKPRVCCPGLRYISSCLPGMTGCGGVCE